MGVIPGVCGSGRLFVQGFEEDGPATAVAPVQA